MICRWTFPPGPVSQPRDRDTTSPTRQLHIHPAFAKDILELAKRDAVVGDAGIDILDVPHADIYPLNALRNLRLQNPARILPLTRKPKQRLPLQALNRPLQFRRINNPPHPL